MKSKKDKEIVITAITVSVDNSADYFASLASLYRQHGVTE